MLPSASRERSFPDDVGTRLEFEVMRPQTPNNVRAGESNGTCGLHKLHWPSAADRTKHPAFRKDSLARPHVLSDPAGRNTGDSPLSFDWHLNVSQQ